MKRSQSDPARVAAAVMLAAGLLATGGCEQILGLDRYHLTDGGAGLPDGGGGAGGTGNGGGGAGGASCEVKGCGEVVWSKAFGSGGAQEGTAVAIDEQGNIVLAGHYSAGSTLTLGNETLTGGGCFIAKFNSSGETIWARGVAPVNGSASCREVAVDASGDVFIVGGFSGSLDVGGGPLVAKGNDDGFIVKLAPDGSHLWSKRMGDAAAAVVLSAAIDASENLLVTGYFQSSLGGVMSMGGNDIFVAKLNGSNGGVVWVRGFGSPVATNEQGVSVASDLLGNVLVTGQGSGQINFGGGALPCGAMLSPSVFMLKLDGSGNHTWSKCYGKQSLDGASRVASDNQGDVFLTGDFGGVVNFGGGDLASSPGSDGFLVKFGPDGSHLWSKQFGIAPGDDAIRALDVDATGNVSIAGNFESLVDVGGVQVGSVGGFDTFLIKYDSNGNELWSHVFGDPAEQRSLALAIDSLDNGIVLTGTFGGTVDFGDGPRSASWGGLGLFLAKFTK